MRGRKPKPATLRRLHGTETRKHHRDRLDPPNVDAPVPNVPLPPKALARDERGYWEQFAPLLAAARVLTPADAETFADYCRACAAVVVRERKLGTELRRRTPDARLVRLYDASMRSWIERKTSLAGELGLTAIARVRVGWTGHAATKAPTTPAAAPTKLAELQARSAELRRPIGVSGVRTPDTSTATRKRRRCEAAKADGETGGADAS